VTTIESTMLLPATRVHEQYFTTSTVGDLLVSSMTVSTVRNVLELGSGNGALLQAVRRRWANAKLTSVDIDGDLAGQIQTIRPNRHVVSDVLSPDFDSTFGSLASSFDAAVCNPPYCLAPWSSSFAKVLRDVGLRTAIPAQGDIAADVVFLAQSIRLLKNGGQLGIIVPDGTVTGSKNRSLREALLESHAVHSVIELPEKSFLGTEAKTYLLTIEKGACQTKDLPLYCADLEGNLSAPIVVSPLEAAERMDYKFYRWRRDQSFEAKVALGEVSGVSVLRGQLEMASAKRAGISLLHSTHLSLREMDKVIRIGPNITRAVPGHKYVRAQSGDILLTRVGRNLEDKIARVRSGTGLVSDCIFVVRGSSEFLSSLWADLDSPRGRAWIRAHTRGVCAKVLNKSDLLGFPVSWSP